MILIEHGPKGQPALFDSPQELLVATTLDEVIVVLDRAEAARRAGFWVAGYLAYEAGYAFEPRLRALLKPDDAPLAVLGVYADPQPATALLDKAAIQASNVRLGPDLHCHISRAEYDAAFARLQGYIAAGDCYQVNLTFPVETSLQSGSALGLYGALRMRQPVGYGAYIDPGIGPVILSRSPELFFRCADGQIETRPMKGTAPRDADPVRDAALQQELADCPKVQAENLMIVDLLRNDIARICQAGSVRVPELFAIDSFATVHQMSSRICGTLAARDAGLADLMAALFPCGSVTGAPKIRAMQIIAELESAPRGVYCGAVGWAAPDGRQCWSVAIRSLRLSESGRILANVGGGVVHDSTATGEWEEALWKTRYLQALTTRACD